MCEGFIKLHRSLFNHWIFTDAEKFKAFVDIIQLAMWKDTKLLIDNEVVIVPRGSFFTSELKLAERWKWTRKRTRNFLNLLEIENMISKKGTTKGTMLTVENYSFYQDRGTTEGTSKGQRRDNEGTSKGHQRDTKEERKERKELKELKENIYSDFELKILELYPGKKVKSIRDKKVPKLLKTYSVEELTRCLERYSTECSTKDKQYILNESTFWNGRYMDYLDINYKERDNGTRGNNKWNYKTSEYTPKSAEELDRECQELELI